MKTIAAIQADLEVTPIGTRSRLADEIGGVVILRRTVERVEQATRIDAVHVLCPTTQLERCTSLLAGTTAVVRPYEAKPAPWSSLVKTARKWSLDGWRGGIGQTTSFDEYTDCRLLKGLLETVEADAVFSVPCAAPLFDPALADRMVEHKQQAEEDVRMVFTQAPPGISGVLLDARLVYELAEKSSPLGWTFAYQPDDPRKDLIFQPCCCEAPRELRHSTGRLMADTDRSAQTIAALLRDHPSPDSTTIGRWLMDRESNHVEPLPREVEIELTTDNPYPDALLRPRGNGVGHRGPIDPEIVDQVVGEISRYDDALVVLGGLGDPVRHPRFAAILEGIRANRKAGRGLYGLAVRTSGADLADEHINAMVTNGVDVLEITLDAWTAELYGRLQSPKDPSAANLETVVSRLERLAQVSRERTSVKPIIVPHMTKARDNVHELDEFYDGWLRRRGAVAVSGCSHFAGQCEDRSCAQMAPAGRFACRRIASRCLVLADGRVAMCDQDFRGLHTLGRIGEQTLEEIWRSDAFERVRQAHRTGRFDPTPLCKTCDEWHRP